MTLHKVPNSVDGVDAGHPSTIPVRIMPSNANEDTCVSAFYLYYTFLLLLNRHLF